MFKFIIYKIGMYSIKSYLQDNIKKFTSEQYKPCNLPVGYILKYSHKLILILI